MSGQTARRAALDRVEQEQARLGQWQAEQAAAEAELAALEGRVGGEVLADPDAAEGLTEELSRLRSRVDVAARAVAAAGKRVDGARRGTLRAEADELDAMAAGLRAQLDEREARTAELLAALQEYTGAKYTLAPLRHPHTGGPSSFTSRDETAERLRKEIGKAEARARELRAAAAVDEPAEAPAVTGVGA